jgi:hypothetical protein
MTQAHLKHNKRELVQRTASWRGQTAAHILLRYRIYNDLRDQVFSNLSRRQNLRAVLNKPQLATKAIEFIEQTRILGQVGVRDA